MSRDVVLPQLEERSAAYQAEAERLRAEAERITGLLAVREAELERLVTARQVVGELPAVHAAAAVADRPSLPAPRTGSAEVSGRGRRQDGSASFAKQVLQVLAGHAGPVRCGQVTEGLGLEITARNVERVRHRLKKAAAAGWWCRRPGACSPWRVCRLRQAGELPCVDGSFLCCPGGLKAAQHKKEPGGNLPPAGPRP